jgi:hypothetical protein
MELVWVMVVIVVGVPLLYFLFKWKASVARQRLTRFMQERNIAGTIVKVGMPPLHLWLHNRKGDSWCQVQMPDGSLKWARVGHAGLFGGQPIEILD